LKELINLSRKEIESHLNQLQELKSKNLKLDLESNSMDDEKEFLKTELMGIR